MRSLVADDVEPLAFAFGALGWPGKDRARFLRCLDEARLGSHVWLVAAVGPDVVGYGGVEWRSRYPPFDDAGVPEVVDLNVLPPWRNRGSGGALMDALEATAGLRSDVVGLGVGLYADYAAAWRLYLRRGYVPDGAGVVHAGAAVPPGGWVRLDDDAAMKLTKLLR
jgi:GNAT superfamily N-acetyltransferase